MSPCRATWPLQRTAPRPESPPRAAQARSPPGCATFRSAQQRIAVLRRRAWSNPPTGSSSGPQREDRSCRRTCPKRATCPRSCGCRRRTCPSDKPGLRAAVQQKLASVGLVGWTPYPGFAPGNRLLSAHPRTSSTGTVRRGGPAHRHGQLGHLASYGPKRYPELTWPECARGDGAERRGNPGLRCERRSHKWKNHVPPVPPPANFHQLLIPDPRRCITWRAELAVKTEVEPFVWPRFLRFLDGADRRKNLHFPTICFISFSFSRQILSIRSVSASSTWVSLTVQGLVYAFRSSTVRSISKRP